LSLVSLKVPNPQVGAKLTPCHLKVGLSDGLFTTMHLFTQNTKNFIGFQQFKQIIVISNLLKYLTFMTQ